MKNLLLTTIAAVLLVGCGESRQQKRAKATLCTTQLGLIDSMKEMWAKTDKKADSDTPTTDQLGKYFNGGVPSCPSGGVITIGAVSNQATCSIHGTAPPPHKYSDWPKGIRDIIEN